MFAFQSPRPRCDASHARIHALSSGSPRSPGTSRVNPRASGQVKIRVSAAYSRNASSVSRRRAWFDKLTMSGFVYTARPEPVEGRASANELDPDFVAGGKVLDDHRKDSRSRDREDRADHTPQRAADQQRH